MFLHTHTYPSLEVAARQMSSRRKPSTFGRHTLDISVGSWRGRSPRGCRSFPSMRLMDWRSQGFKLLPHPHTQQTRISFFLYFFMFPFLGYSLFFFNSLFLVIFSLFFKNSFRLYLKRSEHGMTWSLAVSFYNRRELGIWGFYETGERFFPWQFSFFFNLDTTGFFFFISWELFLFISFSFSWLGKQKRPPDLGYHLMNQRIV